MKKILVPTLLLSLISSPLYAGSCNRHCRDTCSPLEKLVAGVLITGVVGAALYGLYHLIHETPEQAYSRCKSFLFRMQNYSNFSRVSHRDVMYEIYSYSNRRYPVLTYKNNLDSTIAQAHKNIHTMRQCIIEFKKEYGSFGSRQHFLLQEFELLIEQYYAIIPDLKNLSGHIGSMPQYADERKEKRKDERQREKIQWQQTTYYYPRPQSNPHLHVHL